MTMSYPPGCNSLGYDSVPDRGSRVFVMSSQSCHPHAYSFQVTPKLFWVYNPCPVLSRICRRRCPRLSHQTRHRHTLPAVLPYRSPRHHLYHLNNEKGIMSQTKWYALYLLIVRRCFLG
jgi:hypothetical protein